MGQNVWQFDKKLEEEIDRWMQAHQDEFLQDMKEFIAIPSVSGEAEGKFPFGAECAKMLDLALSKAEQYGLVPENYEYYCGAGRLKGTCGGELGMFAHTDVVPLGEGWEYPPLGCTEKDGFLIGRGVGDNKGPALAALYALRFLKEQNIQLKHDVLLFFGCSEETGMDDIEYFVKNKKAPDFSLVPDTNFPVCYGEKGIFRAVAHTKAEGNLVSFHAGTVVNVIPSSAQAVIQLHSAKDAQAICTKLNQIRDVEASVSAENNFQVQITSEGLSRHAAFPEGSINAVNVLAEAIISVNAVDEEAEHIVRGIAALTASTHGETTGIPFEDEGTGKLTCCGTVVRLENGEVTLSFDVRYPSSYHGAQVKEGLSKAVEAFGFTLEDIEDSAPFFISPDRPEVQTLCEIADHVLGRHYEPYTMGGGTYARHLPNAVGFGPGIPDAENPFPAGRGQGHQPDECIKLTQLISGMKAYVFALKALDELI